MPDDQKKTSGRSILVFIFGLLAGLITATFAELGKLIANDIWSSGRGYIEKIFEITYKIAPNEKICEITGPVCFREYPNACGPAQLKSFRDGGFEWSSNGPTMSTTRLICTIPHLVSGGDLVFGGATVGGTLSVPNVIAQIGVRESVTATDLKTSDQLQSTLMSRIQVLSSQRPESTIVPLKVVGGLSNAVVVIEFVDAWGRNTTVSANFEPITLRVRR